MQRRTFLANSARIACGAALAWHHPARLHAQQAPGSSLVQSMLEAGPVTPIKVTSLRDTLFLLQGVGGNMVAQIGPDGQLLVDSSVATAAPRIKQALSHLGPQPLQLLINTHWHFDHTDGNAAMHNTGALIIAHENTRLRMSLPQHMNALDLNFPAAPNSALPQQVFADQAHLFFNADEIRIIHFAPSHTDSDVYVFFKNANVLHAGDIWCNGAYPLIDDSSGGRIDGMIRSSSLLVALADKDTKIVPGHGPLGNKAALAAYRDMLVAVRDRVLGLKQGGRTMEEAQAARPTADFDEKWGKGMMKPDLFVQQVYKTLPDNRA